MIIGLCGYARSGKDTVADILKRDGFQRIAFADGIREALYRLNPKLQTYDGNWVELAAYVDSVGWEEAKKSEDVRWYLQRLGTEVGRDMFGENVWVDLALSKTQADGNYVITDVRYPNEAMAIVRAGGQLWRIERPGFGPANSHVSEIAMDGFMCDLHLVNDGSLEELEAKVRGVSV